MARTSKITPEMLELLLPQRAPEALLVPRWGVVTSIAPLRVQLAGDDDPLPIVPKTMCGNLLPGAVVWCVLQGRDLIVVSQLGGDPLPIEWNGTLGGTDTSPLTASNYKSIKIATQRTARGGWVPEWDADCLIMPYTAYVRIVLQMIFTADSTTGNRFAGLNLNPGVNTLNSPSWPATGRLQYTKFPPSSDTSGGLCEWSGPVTAGDRLMAIARTTSATKVGGATYETSLSVSIQALG